LSCPVQFCLSLAVFGIVYTNWASGGFSVCSFVSLLYSWSARTACIDRFEVAAMNELLSVSEPGHRIVWETCCLEHQCQYQCQCQCPWHLAVCTVWLYTSCVSRTTM
jgi:hypothetical protein